MKRHFFRSGLLLAALIVLNPTLVLAEGFHPAKPVRIIVPFPPGGATDALARLMADKLSERWSQTVIVENKPGANTTLGTDVVAKSAPDGTTLGLVTGSHAINPLLSDKLPYDTRKDLTGVMAVARAQMAIYAHPSLPANTPAEFLALARREKVPYASATTQSYLGMARLASMAGLQLEYIPYKGSAQAATDLMGGHVKVMIDPVTPAALEQVRTGKMKLIGTLGSSPSELLPGVPTFASNVKGYDFSAVFGLVARGSTPPALVHQIRDEFADVMKRPEIAQRMRESGLEAIASTPEEYDAYIAKEMETWRPVVMATGARLD